MLDRLELDGVVDARTAAALRDLVMPPSRQPLSPEVVCLMMLHHAVLQPERSDTRAAKKRDYAIAYLHAYYVSIGDWRATSRIANDAKISVKTVSNAVRNCRISNRSFETELRIAGTADGLRSAKIRTELLKGLKVFSRSRPGNKKG